MPQSTKFIEDMANEFLLLPNFSMGEITDVDMSVFMKRFVGFNAGEVQYFMMCLVKKIKDKQEYAVPNYALQKQRGRIQWEDANE